MGCVYCGANGPLTREHGIPAWLYEQTSDQTEQFFARKDDFVDTELQIRDVCHTCNHERLGQLDSSARALYDRHLQHYVGRGDSVEFKYDFDELARWLLKVAYNVARINGNGHEEFEPFVQYIWRGTPRPMKFSVFVQILIPTQVPEHIQRQTGEREFLPNSIRIGKASESPYWRFDLCRRVGVKSYDFRIVGSNNETISEKRWRSMLRTFEVKGIPGARRLGCNKTLEILSASQNDAYGSCRGFFLANHAKIFERRRNRPQNWR